jgi:DNA-binding MarR family transcriptional regulator
VNLTQKQKAILALIVKGNPGDPSTGEPDTPIDFDQLIERLPYQTSKQSMHFSVRALVARGLIEKGGLEARRGRARRLISPTPLGLHWAALVCPKPVPLTVEEVIDLDEIEALEESLGLI